MNNNHIKNYYNDKGVKKYLSKEHNPAFNNHLIKIPFRMCVIGPSGSAKSNSIINILERMRDTFNVIHLVIPTSDEPLYRFLKDRLKDKLVIHEGYNEIPTIEELNKANEGDDQGLIIFDDMVGLKGGKGDTAKTQLKISEWWKRGRKCAKNYSMIYASQRYFDIPIFIRSNCNYCIIKKLGDTRDVLSILKGMSLNITKDELMNMYEYCISGEFQNFLLIDKDKQEFRKNFLELLN